MKSAPLIRQKFKALAPVLDERTRRLFAAAEAQALGYGGVSCVARVTGVSRRAIHAGLREIARGTGLPTGRIRKAGAGRKRATERDPGLPLALERLVEPLSRGDPESPLRWTCKSTQRLADELRQRGHPASARLVASLLHAMHYSLQGNRTTQEGGQQGHPRDLGGHQEEGARRQLQE